MNDRPTASTINDQQLDELHERAEQAEAAIARVREAIDSVKAAAQGHAPTTPYDRGVNRAVDWVTMRVLEAIDARLVSGASVSGPAATQATEPDTCRPVEVDGQTIRVRGSGQFTEQEQEFAADIVRAAKRKYAAEHPEEQPMPVCTATIEGPHVPGDSPVQCTREVGHPENHVGPNQDGAGRTLWTDHNAGATPHQTSSEEQH
jgi:hypothetical protein